MSFGSTIKLNSGTEIPTIGLGTWQAAPGEVADAVKTAVKNGYRHLDLARVYGNQDEIGGALKELIPSVVKREELFITSKLWNNSHKPEDVEAALDETLKQLGTPYLDLYLIHWPVAFKAGKDLFPKTENGKEVLLDEQTSLVDTWKALLALPKEKVKAVGVSNFTIPQLEAVIKATGQAPAVNQIEAHPHLPQDDLVAFAKEKNIHLTAYSPLGNNSQGLPLLTESSEVKQVADKIGATTGQVLIAWGVKRGYSVIPKSVQESRIIGNFKQVELSDEDYKTVSQISKGKNSRFNIPINYAPSWSIDVFGEPEEAKAAAQVKLGA